jgi:Rieske Fe-S protein
MAEPNKLERRDFVKVVTVVLGSIMGAVIAIPAISYLLSPAASVQKKESWISLGPLENYPVMLPTLYTFVQTTVNGWEKTANSYGVYVVRYDDSAQKVFSNKCTHLSCRVTWQEGPQDFLCPCHDGSFNIEGQVVSGPPPAPLVEYDNKVEEGILYFYFAKG